MNKQHPTVSQLPQRIYFGIYMLYLLLALIITYPAVLRFFTHFIGNGGDNIEYVSYQYIASQKIYSGEWPFSDSSVYRHPYGFKFGSSSDARSLTLLGGIMLEFFPDTLVFNTLILCIISLNGFVTFLFFNILGFSKRISFIGGIIYGFSYFTLARGAGFMNLLQIYCFPLTGYFFMRLLKCEEKIQTNIYLFVFSYVIAALASLQYLLISVSGTFIIFVYFFLCYYERMKYYVQHLVRQYIRTWIASLILSGIVFLSLFYQLTADLILGNLPKEYQGMSVNLMNFFTPVDFLPTYAYKLMTLLTSNPTRGAIDNALFLGFIEILFFVYFALFQYKHSWHRLLISLTVIFWILALGTQTANGTILPLHWLKLFPPFKFIAESERYNNIFYLFFTIAVVLGIQKIQNMRYHRELYVCLIALLVLERTSFSYFTVPAKEYRGNDYERFVAKQPGSGVLDLPLILDGDSFYKTEYNLLPFYYKKSIVEGYFHWISDNGNARRFLESDLLSSFKCSFKNQYIQSYEKQLLLYKNILITLKNSGVNSIVIHKRQLSYQHCADVQIRVQDMLHNFEFRAQNFDGLKTDSTQGYSVYLYKIFEDDLASVYKIQ